jgi:hypothetical protein
MSVHERLSAEIRNGQPIHLGKFWQERNAQGDWIRIPIEWIPIKKTSVPYLTDRQTYTLELISKKVLYLSSWGLGYTGTSQYCPVPIADTWITSRIREKLQEQFFDIFDEEERSFIKDVPANVDCIWDDKTRILSDTSYDAIVNSSMATEWKNRLLAKDKIYLLSNNHTMFNDFREMARLREISSKDEHESEATEFAKHQGFLFGDSCKSPGGVEYWTKTIALNWNKREPELEVCVVCGLVSGGGARTPESCAGIRPCITIEVTVVD